MNNKTSNTDRLIHAYRDMVKYLHQVFSTVQDDIKPRIKHTLETVSDVTDHLQELTKEEVETVRDYIIRDLHDAAKYIEDNGAEFKDWMNLEVNLVEDLVVDWMPILVDETRLALDEFKQQADQLGVWHTGEIVSPGVFKCVKCGKQLELYKVGHIPPCASCNGAEFRRSQT